MTTPLRRHRIAVALAIGIASFIITVICLRRGHSDYEFWWKATKLWLSGVDPYQLAADDPAWALGDRLFYPLPAMILTIPVVWLPVWLAGSVTLGIAGGVLAYLLSRDGWGRLWIFATPSYFMALNLGQWSPLLTIAALSSWAGVYAAAKPTLGAAVLAFQVSWRQIAAAAFITLASVIIMPSWPQSWLYNLQFVIKHPAPIMTLGGCWMVLAALRWRRPEGRLLFAYACVPQLLFFADQLPLYLATKDRKESGYVAFAALIAFLIWYSLLHTGVNYVEKAAPYVLGAVYLPLLILVLRRPNEGPVPAAVEKFAARFPMWLRGAPGGSVAS